LQDSTGTEALIVSCAVSAISANDLHPSTGSGLRWQVSSPWSISRGIKLVSIFGITTDLKMALTFYRVCLCRGHSPKSI
jgi:hypothetical protein